jgi:hypothetical protein
VKKIDCEEVGLYDGEKRPKRQGCIKDKL